MNTLRSIFQMNPKDKKESKDKTLDEVREEVSQATLNFMQRGAKKY